MAEGLEEGRELVFVYGTLRSGAPDAVRMVDMEWVGNGRAKGVLYSIDSRPALVYVHDEGWNVVGEIHRASVASLRELDEFHGIPSGESSGSHYRRVRRSIVSSRSYSERHEVWLWEWTGGMEDKVKIRSGNWMEVAIPRTTPIMTWVAFGCLLAGPLMLFAYLYFVWDPMGSSDDFIENVVMVLSLASPFAGCLAVYLAGRRRERQKVFRLVSGLLLVSEALLVVWILANMG
ncbi:gamma-glutamylcyclotransferase [Luteolibacter sp. GHJ8]|uniref:Gamma-glutamylcyclotransferase n=1 Tax=Luteolibacter rhizosphaerae TaxID=2989719 RepID=A0ABT3G154_9BACT|nr:gamma-glutamylcyclotransferase family protein [Luteolibacter rhizosphaerae]MCW1913556.1 gamma-glutamylcyclotransferase [Luteolibacter rhizosphaerae]